MMTNKKIGLAFFEKDGWVSCQNILTDLVTTYQKTFGDDFIFIPIYSNKQTLPEFVKQVLELKPTSIIFMSYGFKWADWIQEFLEQTNQPPTFTIHLYGSFLWQMTELVKASSFIHQCSLRFITASNALLLQGQKLFKNKASVKKISFPFLDQAETLSQAQINDCRIDQGIKAYQKVILYAGRISRQKNVISLMKLFEKYHLQNPHTKLIICGSPDDFYWPLEKGHYLNFEAEKFFLLLEDFQSRKISIDYVGHLSKKQLDRYYQLSDAFVSLSTFEGEDWGRAVLEARLHGLPAVLTAWGGFRDFKDDKSIFLCPVNLENGKMMIDEDEFFENLTRALNQGHNLFQGEEFSFAKISNELKDFYNDDLLGTLEYSSFFKMLVHFHIMQGNGDQEFYERYEELFSSFWK